MNKYKSVILLLERIVLFSVSPLLSLFFSIKDIKKGQHYAYYLVGFVFSLFGAFMPPTSDAYRYREMFYTFNTIDWANLYTSTKNKDWLFPLLCNEFNGLGFSFEMFKFILLAICYSSYIYMYLDIAHNNKNLKLGTKKSLWAFAALVFSIRLFTLCSGIRFGIASTLLIVSFYLLYKKDYIKSILLYLVCFFTHFSVFIYFPMVLVSYLMLKLPLHRFVKLILLGVSVFYFSHYLSPILDSFSDTTDMADQVNEGYVIGQWGTANILETASINGLLFTWIRLIPLIPFIYIYFRYSNNTLISNLAFLGLLFLAISFDSITFILRYGNITIALLFLYLLLDVDYSEMQIKVVWGAFILVFFSYVYSVRKELKTLYPATSIVCPTLLGGNPYTDDWVNNNVDIDGELK